MSFQPVKGTRDFLPDDEEKRSYIIKTFRKVAEESGFRPVKTPALESFELLSAKGGLGEAVKDEIYYFKDKGGREIGLRFDMTMPLARIASDRSIQKPFKRYTVGKVWRYDNPQRLRYREFTQADIDIIGSKSVMADIEIIATTCRFLERLGFKDYFIRFSNRRLIQSIFEKIMDKKKIPEAFRIIDKMDKIGAEKVRAELEKIDVPVADIAKVITLGDDFDKIKSFIKKNYGCEEELKEVQDFIDYSKSIGISKKLRMDLSLVRGLDYYSGIVYEVFLGDNVSFGAGGRYDNLISNIGGDPNPATGISFGIDRIFELMKEKKMIPESRETKTFVASVDDSVRRDAMKIAEELRSAGLRSDFDIMERNLSKQLEYASSAGYTYTIIVGKKELAEGKVKLKSMKDKSEKAMTVADAIKALLKSNER